MADYLSSGYRRFAGVLSLFLLLLHPLSTSTAAASPRRSYGRGPAGFAEGLIRDLNLLPGVPDGAGRGDRVGSGPSLVERRVKLPVAGDAGSEIPLDELGQHAGYFRLPHTHAEEMFYFFFESRGKSSDPVVIWLTGGPGCSSELALFYENGPFKITDNLTLVWNEYGWDKVSNLIYVDQPTGTGFSYSKDPRDVCLGENCVANDLYDFLQAFFGKHPEFLENDFYITGESYAGHYIPAFGARVDKGNKEGQGLQIRLKGMAIGNGLTDPDIQYGAYADFALQAGLISEGATKTINKLYKACHVAIKLCDSIKGIGCIPAFYVCNYVFEGILLLTGNINYYDIRKQCEGSLCYDFSNLDTFLNSESVKEVLGVGNRQFVSCNTLVYEGMIADWMQNLEVGLPDLVDSGIKLLIYAGEYDLICNWLGNYRWVNSMQWSGASNFSDAAMLKFIVDSKEAGLIKSYGPLSFLKVHDAGHMVPMDQPKAALEMLRRWINGTLVGEETGSTIQLADI